MSKPTTRLDARLYTVRHEIDVPGDPAAGHVFEMQVGIGPDGRVVEVAFAGRGKIGHGVDLLLSDVGLWVSRLLQERDPATGEALPAEAQS